jgi:hypothetical protein
MRDSVPLTAYGEECDERDDPQFRQSRHLTEYLGQELVYPNDLHKDINGDWSTCCNCLW